MRGLVLHRRGNDAVLRGLSDGKREGPRFVRAGRGESGPWPPGADRTTRRWPAGAPRHGSTVRLALSAEPIPVTLHLHDTLTRARRPVRVPGPGDRVTMYSCGPTVYWYQHIGNLRTYIFSDILRRTLEFEGYKVKQVMNVTDVGHLTSDADSGEDKMEKAAAKEHRTAHEIAEFYLKVFQEDLKKLNIENPDVWCKATEHIKEQIGLVKVLEKKGWVSCPGQLRE